MSKQRKLFLFGCFVIIDILLVGGFVLLRSVTLKNVLENEVTALVELDFTKDRFNTKIKCSGDYKIVEETLKEYLDTYAIEVQNVMGATNDKTLNSLISIENIIQDGPFFVNSFSYIEEYRKDFNDNIDNVIISFEENDIANYIYKYTNDEEIVTLYQELVENNKFRIEIENTILELELEKVDTNSHLDAITSVLEFLSVHSDYYYVDDGEVKFTNISLYAEYVRLIEKTKRIYD